MNRAPVVASAIPGERTGTCEPMRGIGITVYGCEPDEAEVFDELSPRVGVIPTVIRAHLSETSPAPPPGTRCISVGHKSRISAPILRGLRDAGVQYVSTRSIGLDHIDLAAAEAMGITVENVAYAPDGVADHTLMLMLMAIRGARSIVRAAAGGDLGSDGVRGKELRDMTVGVLGVGSIGTAVIRRLQGFGCRVLGSTNGRTPAVAASLVPLDELLLESDVVTLHLPLTPHTHHLLGRPQIETMKPGAFVVNTGRGALVDTEALIVALEGGRLGGAALDVLEGEEGVFYPDGTGRPVDTRFLPRLRRLPNVIVTPHVAYHTERALYETVEGTLASCLRFARRAHP